MSSAADVIVIGGGLAGLTVITFLARAGKSVTLFEQSTKEIGGRARTSVFDGFYFVLCTKYKEIDKITRVALAV
jgi:phytoene dehydrogenase-like protein